MNFNAILSAFFGNKASRDIKKIQPLVEKVKAAYPAIQALSNDELRAKSKEIQAYVQNSANDLKKQIEELKAKTARDEWMERIADIAYQHTIYSIETELGLAIAFNQPAIDRMHRIIKGSPKEVNMAKNLAA